MFCAFCKGELGEAMSMKMKKVKVSNDKKQKHALKKVATPSKPVKKVLKASSAMASKATVSKAKPSKVAPKPSKGSPIKAFKALITKAPKASGARVPDKIKASVKKDLPLKTSDKAKSKKKIKSREKSKIRESEPTVRVIERKAPAKPAAPIKITKEMLEIRARLQTMLGEMRRDIDHEVRGASERDLAHINDTSDMASDAAEGDLALRIAESETVEAEEIERAIEKIDNGTYGICEMCNKPIGVDRIKFLPYVTLCIKCQELSEIRRRDDGDELDDLAEGAETDNDA